MNPSNMTPDQLEELAKSMFSSNKAYFGGFILGGLIDAILCGILLMQCGTYVSSCAHDRWFLKAAVAWVILMNLLGTSLIWAWLWEVFVRNFAIYRTLFSLEYTAWTSMMTIATTLPVQTFFGLRAWKLLNRNLVFGVAVFALTLAYVGIGSNLTILQRLYPYTTYTEYMSPKTTGLTYTCCGSLLVADLLITTTILWHLLHWRGGSRHTQDLLKKLARITFESQLPPALITIALLATYSPAQNNPATVPLLWVQPKLYVISLLHTLNMRQELAAREVVVETACTGFGHTTQWAVGPAQIVQTGEPDIAPHNQAISVSQTRGRLSTRRDPPSATFVSFGEVGVATTLGGTLKLDDMPVVSHGGFDNEMEMVERKSEHPDSASETTIAS
ncbi:hypothetical protein FRC08_014638 [Ceratobasidium sp. 394]|nr:hypothetical protein FRC08_014638 [Ceratobasidium sp. 394]